MKTYNHIDLFSGIGGFALASHWNGIKTIQFVEIDPRCKIFLSKAWPGIPIHDNIKTFRWTDGRMDGRPIYLLTAGVPCQPASRAGKQRGQKDDRWLWPEALRVFSEVKPTWAIFENPPGIGDVGLKGILAQVENEGYEVRVFSIPACAVNAPHIRERFWIVCRKLDDTNGDKYRKEGFREADRIQKISGEKICPGMPCGTSANSDMADTCKPGHQRPDAEPGKDGLYSEYNPGHMANASEDRRKDGAQCDFNKNAEQLPTDSSGNFWSNSIWLPCADGKVRRAPDDSFGLVDGLHRSVIAALGNSIVPQVAYQIIKSIIETG
jgi:DNA (cytosine-5)-methyltransferase 1